MEMRALVHGESSQGISADRIDAIVAALEGRGDLVSTGEEPVQALPGGGPVRVRAVLARPVDPDGLLQAVRDAALDPAFSLSVQMVGDWSEYRPGYRRP